MPYITTSLRTQLNEGATPSSPGELNWKITTLLVEYLRGHTVNYGRINDVLGALEGAKMEFYRRVAVPYEEQKREQNGDVY